MAEQTTSRNRRAAERRERPGGGEVARRRRSVAEDADGADRSELLERDLDEEPAGEASDAMQGPRTVRGELASIVREAALEVLGPIAKNATTRTAKYAVSKGPTLAKDALLPRLKDTLGPRIEEAGGAGALAKDALSTASGAGGGLLSKVGVARSRDGDAAATGMGRRLPVHEWVDVAVPVETAYNQFTQFEDFPDFIQSAMKVEQVDDARLVWHLRLWGMRREWEIEITDQRPNERIAWRSVSDGDATGVVTFHPLSDRLTRIEVVVRLQPHGLLEKAAGRMRMSRRALRSDLTRFKAFIELRDEETGAWPGRIKEGEVVDRQRSSRRATREEKRVRKPSSRRRGGRGRGEGREEEPEDDEYESGAAYEGEPEDQESEPEDAEEPEDEDYDEEDEDYDEEGPRAAEDEEGPEDEEEPEDEDSEEEEPVAGRRPVRRRSPARPLRQSRGRR